MSRFERFSQSKPNLIHYGWIEKKKTQPNSHGSSWSWTHELDSLIFFFKKKLSIILEQPIYKIINIKNSRFIILLIFVNQI